MIPIESSHTVAAYSTCHGWHVIEVWLCGHRCHRRFEIAGQFRIHMFLEQINHSLLH
jgi:hypothetical protein